MSDNFDIQSTQSEVLAHMKKDRAKNFIPDEWAKRLEGFIKQQDSVSGNVNVYDVKIANPNAGASSGVYIFTAEFDEGQGMRKQDLVLRVCPDEGLFHNYDMQAQFTMQKELYKTDVPVPRPYWIDKTGDYFGLPGFIMERVYGSAPDQSFYTNGILATASPENRRRMISGIIDALSKIHEVDWQALDLDFLKDRAKGEKPMQREVNWYWDALNWCLDKSKVDTLREARDWLIENEPANDKPVLTHGDPNLANYMFQDSDVVSVLDWEMAFLGSPECDLASQITSTQLFLEGMATRPEGIPTEEEWKSEYEKISARKLRDWDYYLTFACFKRHATVLIGTRSIPPEALEKNKVFFNLISEQLSKRGQLHGFNFPSR